MAELKSTLDIVMEKIKALDGSIPEPTEVQKQRIGEIRREFEAKIAERKILVSDRDQLAVEILKLEEKREKEIAKVYQGSL